jgi:hypothetical protein
VREPSSGSEHMRTGILYTLAFVCGRRRYAEGVLSVLGLAVFGGEHNRYRQNMLDRCAVPDLVFRMHIVTLCAMQRSSRGVDVARHPWCGLV